MWFARVARVVSPRIAALSTATAWTGKRAQCMDAEQSSMVSMMQCTPTELVVQQSPVTPAKFVCDDCAWSHNSDVSMGLCWLDLADRSLLLRRRERLRQGVFTVLHGLMPPWTVQHRAAAAGVSPDCSPVMHRSASPMSTSIASLSDDGRSVDSIDGPPVIGDATKGFDDDDDATKGFDDGSPAIDDAWLNVARVQRAEDAPNVLDTQSMDVDPEFEERAIVLSAFPLSGNGEGRA